MGMGLDLFDILFTVRKVATLGIARLELLVRPSIRTY